MIFVTIEDPNTPAPNNYIVYCDDGVVQTRLSAHDAGALVRQLNNLTEAKQRETLSWRQTPMPAHLAAKAKLRLRNKKAQLSSDYGNG